MLGNRSLGIVNNKGQDQPSWMPAHPQSGQRLCYSLMGKYHYLNLPKAKFQISSVSVAEQAGLGMSFSETPKTGFLASRHMMAAIIGIFYGYL